jgi:pilus assembly protein CpaC
MIGIHPIPLLVLLLSALLLVGPGHAAAPVDQAPLEIDLGAGDMHAFEGNAVAVYVANPDIADVQLRTPMLIYLFGKAAGETTLTVIGEGDTVLMHRRVIVSHNVTRLTELIADLHPDARVKLSSIRESLVISGQVPSASAAEDIEALARTVIGEDGLILNQLSVAAPNQINLRVRIAEVSREVTKRLGFSWDVVRSGGELAFGLATGGFVSGGVSGSSILSLSRDGSRFDVNGIIDALDDQGLITVLAEPNLTALSGESAAFLAGGEFPIPVPQDEDTIAIVFREFGVSLNFMPVVLDGDRLHIKVSTAVSQLSTAGAVQFSGFNIPALTVREATTTVNLGSGQSFAIAGLLQNRTNQDTSGVAGLADIPIIGALFRSTDFQRDESELVVIVTPYIVRPTSDRLAAPTDGFLAPSDGEQVAEGADYSARVPDRRRGPLGADGIESLGGPGGFLLQ